MSVEAGVRCWQWTCSRWIQNVCCRFLASVSQRADRTATGWQRSNKYK